VVSDWTGTAIEAVSLLVVLALLLLALGAI
jgi:hypothetical protein